MNNFWLKVRVWTKITLLVLVGIYTLLFLLQNSGQAIDLWLFFGAVYKVSALVLAFLACAVGVVGTLLVRTTLNTIKQVRDLRARNRAARIERDVHDMKTRAAMLKTTPSQTPVDDDPAPR